MKTLIIQAGFDQVKNQLSTLNKGIGYLGGDKEKNVIKGMRLTIDKDTSADQLIFHSIVYGLMKGEFAVLLQSLSLIGLKDIDLSDTGSFYKDIQALKTKLTEKIEKKQVLARVDDPVKEKAEAAQKVRAYLDSVVAKLRTIKSVLE